MPRFSLIVPTAGRTIEVAEFLASIVAQNRNDVELIVVDQNDDDRIVPLLRALPGSIAVIHLKQQRKSPPNCAQQWSGCGFRRDHRVPGR